MYEPAKMLHADIPGSSANNVFFKASRGQFDTFKKRSVYLQIKQYIRHVLYIRKVKIGNHWRVWNGLIQLTGY